MSFYDHAFNCVLFNFSYQTAFFAAIEKGNIEMIKTLLSYDKIDPNTENIYILNF